METISFIHYDYEDPQSLYSLDSKFIDASHHALHSTMNPILSANPTYTSLEPVYPESPLAPSNLQYLGTAPTNYYNYPSNTPVYAELPPPQHSSMYSLVKKESEGTSSPPISSSSSHRSSNNSPDSTVSSSSVYATAPECARCTGKDDIIWCNTHFLCKKCLPQMPIITAPEQAAFVDQSNIRKKKRTTGNKNINEICSNCGTNHSTLWRRSLSGESVCNACGLYERLHKFPRPKSMRKDTIQTRKRKSKDAPTPKPKKSFKKSPRNSPEITADQPEYVPNSLPNYESLQMRNLHSSPVVPSMSSQPVFFNYRQELYRHDMFNPVSPNDVINISPSVPSSSMQLYS